jgi:hypothetical protein
VKLEDSLSTRSSIARAKWVQPTPYVLKPTLTFYSPISFSNKLPCIHHLPVHASRPAHLILLNSITLIIFGEKIQQSGIKTWSEGQSLNVKKNETKTKMKGEDKLFMLHSSLLVGNTLTIGASRNLTRTTSAPALHTTCRTVGLLRATTCKSRDRYCTHSGLQYLQACQIQ